MAELTDPRPVVAMAMPNRGVVKPLSAQAFYARPSDGRYSIVASTLSSSILEACFNSLWCEALNIRAPQRPKYFAMLHDDVQPEHFWLDKLIDELEETGADLMSTVVPVKDLRGLTSTSVGDDQDLWSTTRRVITMREAMELPETFGREDIDWPTCGPVLMPNTGCWVCRFDQPWAERVCFRTESKNFNVNGQWISRVMSEDWLLGYDLYRMGLKVMVTRKVAISHDQEFWTNTHAWGEWGVDKVWQAHEQERLAISLRRSRDVAVQVEREPVAAMN